MNARVYITAHGSHRLRERIAPLIEGDPHEWAIEQIERAEAERTFSRKPPKWACPPGWMQDVNKWLNHTRKRDGDSMRYVKSDEPRAVIVVGRRSGEGAVWAVVTVIVP